LDYRYRATTYHIIVSQAHGDSPDFREPCVSVDGVAQPGLAIPLVDDGNEHEVLIALVNLRSAAPVPVA
ncbi:MAG: hypothetical protein ABI983_04480, partial [Acidobacteriota bacterium]